MKKKLISALMAVTVLTSAFSMIASAEVPYKGYFSGGTYNLSLNAVQDFSEDLSGVSKQSNSDMQISTVHGYGNVINLDNSQTYVMNLPEVMDPSNKYLLSFDMKIPKNDQDRGHFEIFSNTTEDTETFSKIDFLMTYNGRFWDNTFNVALGGHSNMYTSDWVHIDMIFNYEENMLLVYSSNGADGSTSLSSSTDNAAREINQINKIQFRMYDLAPGDDSRWYFDNIYLNKIENNTDAGDGIIKRVGSNKLEINFLKTLSATTDWESDLKVTRTALDGSVTDEEVTFYLDEFSNNKVVIELEDFKAGYKYKVTTSAKSASGLDLTVPEVKVAAQNKFDVSWDFENGPMSGFAASDRGLGGQASVLESWSMPFKIPESVGGTYLLSYDFYDRKNYRTTIYSGAGNAALSSISDGDGFRRYKENGFATGNYAFSGTTSNGLIGAHMLPTGVWYRFDHVMYIDEGYADVYIDGVYVAKQPLWDAWQSAETKNNPIAVFKGTQLYGQKGTIIDNVRIKSIENTYNATLSAKDKYVFVDFNETTLGLTEDNFALSMKSSPTADAEDVDFTLAYTNQTRAVLELDSNIVGGATYTVRMTGVASTFETPLASNSVSYTVPSMANNVKFVNTDGEESEKDAVASDTNEIKIYFENGLDEATSALDYSLVTGEDTVSLTESYDEETKVLTLTSATLLGAGKDYTFTFTGAADSSFNYYDDIEINFTTGAAVTKLSNPTLTNETVSVPYVNTGAAATYKAIFASYNGTKLEAVSIKDLTIAADEKDTATATGENLGSYTKLSVFVWDSVEAMNPKTSPASN